MSQEELFDSEDVLERLDQLEDIVRQLTQLGDFEKRVDKIHSRITELASYLNSLERTTKEYSGELDDKAQEVSEKWGELVEHTDEVDERIDQLVGKIAGADSKLANTVEKIGALEERADNNNADLKEQQESISFEKRQLAELKSELANLFERKDLLAAYHDSIFGKVTRIQERISIDQYYELNEEDQEGWKLSDNGESYYKYIEEEIPGSKSRLEDELSNHQDLRERYSEEYNKLHSNIKKLAKGAVEVSLAKGYAKAEGSHSFSLVLWTVVLVACLIGIVAAQVLPYHYEIFPAWVHEGTYLVKLLFILPMISPLIVLACIASKNSNIHRRFVEEYRYKKTLAATYNGLREQFSQMDDYELADRFTNKLLEQSLAASGHNPSSLMDKGKSDIPLTRVLDIFEKTGARTIKLPTWDKNEVSLTSNITDRQPTPASKEDDK